MFQKVLIAEDQSIIHYGLEKTLGDMGIVDIHMAQYCDDALLKIRAAIQQQNPFELLITDLSFKEDHRKRDITSGEDLITAIGTIQPELKVIIFSVEHRIGKIKKLLNIDQVHGYVEKGREESKDIRKAIQAVINGETYCSQGIQQLLRSTGDLSQIDEYDTLMLQLLAKGRTMDQIVHYFKEREIPASSKSSLEKRLHRLKTLFNVSNPKQLLALIIEQGLI